VKHLKRVVIFLILLSFLAAPQTFSFSLFFPQLLPELKTSQSNFEELYALAAICALVEKQGKLWQGMPLEDFLHKLFAIDQNERLCLYAVILPHEIIIELPDEGIGVRYFDPVKANPVTPFSYISRIYTKKINHRLKRQVVFRKDKRAA
jgi:hypothetical protein